MSFDPVKHHRKSIRLPGYDYTAPGSYFVTVVARGRLSIFGEIIGGEMRLNSFGEIANAEWLRTASIRREIELDEFIIMPNHFHAIVNIVDCGNDLVGAQRRCAPTDRTDPSKPHVTPNSIGAIIRAYKSAVTYQINQLRGTPGAPIWQRNYHEHIIRDMDELSRIRKYIRNNPMKWEMDDENANRRR